MEPKEFKVGIDVVMIKNNKYIRLDHLVLAFADMSAEGYNMIPINDLIRSLRSLKERKE